MFISDTDLYKIVKLLFHYCVGLNTGQVNKSRVVDWFKSTNRNYKYTEKSIKHLNSLY